MGQPDRDGPDRAPVRRSRKRALMIVAMFGLMVGLALVPATSAQALPPPDGNVYANACHHNSATYVAKKYPASHHPNPGMTGWVGTIPVAGYSSFDCGYEQGWLVIWVSGWKTYWPINWAGQPTICCWS